MNVSWKQRLGAELCAVKDIEQFRHRLTLQSAQGPRVVIDNREFLNFSSNDYLGLANNQGIKDVFKSALDKYGVGSGASHLVVGHSEPYESLEKQIADWTGRDRAVVFSSGYMANLGIFNALLTKRDSVFADKLNHASLVDAAIASPASVSRFRHADLSHLEKLIDKQERTDNGLGIIATDGVFSMDGDIADLPALSGIARESGSLLVVDDAHGLGVLGKSGAGSAEYFSLDQDNLPVLMGTFGKALGCAGAFVAGPCDLIELIIQRSRNYIYTTASPPAQAAAISKSIELVRNGQHLRAHLQQLISHFRQGLSQIPFSKKRSVQIESHTPIQPVVLGDNSLAVEAARLLRARGLLVIAIRPPTVPRNTARLRITLSAAHSLSDIDELLKGLYEVFSILGLCK